MEKKRVKQRRKDKRGDSDQPTKQEKAVATYLRFNCPTKTTSLQGEEVHYFQGAKAVDLLMESKWKTGAKKSEILFTNRSSCVNYMQNLLDRAMFWRARKLVPKRKDRDQETKEKEQQKKKKQQKKVEEKESGTPGASSPLPDDEENGSKTTDKTKTGTSQSKSPKKQKGGKKVAPENGEEEDEENADKAEEDKEKDESKKKAKKVKLVFHQEQIFKDGTDVYVWHFDPTPWTKFLLGLGIVVGSIVLCLFPLWPPWMRLSVYYVSVVLMGFVGVLIGLIVLRSVVFGVVWACSWGRHHFWILPNLTEDCGFFDSFKPYYSHKYVGDGEDGKKKKKQQKEEDLDEKEKDSSEGGEKEEGEPVPTDTDRESEEGSEQEESKEESSVPGTPNVEGVRKRKTRKEEVMSSGKNGNGFEMVDRPEDE